MQTKLYVSACGVNNPFKESYIRGTEYWTKQTSTSQRLDKKYQLTFGKQVKKVLDAPNHEFELTAKQDCWII